MRRIQFFLSSAVIGILGVGTVRAAVAQHMPALFLVDPAAEKGPEARQTSTPTLRFALWLTSVVLIVLLPILLQAQQPTGGIKGVVLDPSGAVVSGANVAVIDQERKFTLRVTTSDLGAYSASSLAPGNYEVRVQADGFETAILRLVVEVGRITSADIHLAIGSVQETVRAVAQRVAVNPTQTSLEGVITPNEIHDLPLNGRNFMDLGQLEPGAQLLDLSVETPTKGAYTSLSMSGATGESTRITVDGLDISDEIDGSNAQNISEDAIQEFQVSRASFDISTGLTGEGAINVVTRSGGNDVHGSAFFYWRDHHLAARVGPTELPFSRKQFGFNAGGPFRRDKLFWYASYERNYQNGAVATAISGFPQLTDTWPAPFFERMAMGRLDWNASNNVRLFIRFTHDFNDGVGTGRLGIGGTQLSPFASRNNANQIATGADANDGRYFHSFRFGYLDFQNTVHNTQIKGLPIPLSSSGVPYTISFEPFGQFDAVNRPPVVGPSALQPLRLLQHNYESRYDGGGSFGSHSVRWGALVNVIRANWYASFFGAAPEMDISFDSANEAKCGSDLSCYPITSAVLGNGLGATTDVPTLGFPYGGAKNTRLHWYIGDSWRAGRRLNLNFGVRYVYEPGQNNPDLKKPALLNTFMPGLANPDRRDKDNFAPQIGLSWDPTGGGKWVLRGSAGMFYDINFLNSPLFYGSEMIPPGISWTNTFIPYAKVLDPRTGAVIFDMYGSDPTAQITPGVNWVSGCQDPRFPSKQCPLGTPGLVDAILAAWKQYVAASAAATANFPSGPTIFEQTRSTSLLFLPDWHTPYSLHFTVGAQRELRPGLVVSADYVRIRGLRYTIQRDYNRVGAADTLNIRNALAAMDITQTAFGCQAGLAGVPCAISRGASIEDYAANGLGRGEAASDFSPNNFAFPGMNPNFNQMQLGGNFNQSTYNALQVMLRGRLPDVKRLIRDWNITASYSLSRYEAAADDLDVGSTETIINNDNPLAYFGPTTLDRTHIFSAASTFVIPGGVQLNSIWRFASALPSNVIVPQVTGSAAEIFRTDFNGDGTVGDPLPGTNRGSYGRDMGCGARALNRVIDAYNSKYAGNLTPAGRALVNAGLFTTTQLKQLGAVSPEVQRAPDGQVCLGSFSTTDVRIGRPIRFLREWITVEPALEIFNLFNIANYDMPGNKLLGILNGAPGSINGTTTANRTNRAGFGGGSFSQGVARSWQLMVRISF